MDRRKRFRSALLAAGALMLAAPATGQATTAAATIAMDSQGVVTYQAAPGQFNDIVLASQRGDGSSAADQDVIIDSGVTTIADTDGAGGCSASGNIAYCPPLDVFELQINLGDQRDRLETVGFGDCPYTYPVTINAGDGGDTIYTGNSCDSIFGGPGNDRIYSGGGVDRVMGEGGKNQINGQAGDDILVGGPERDTIYGERTGDVNLDAPYQANDKILGGPGKDRLYGGYGTDTLFGDYAMGAGTDGDRMYGGADGDYLFGSGARDTIYGESGRDQLFGFGGRDGLSGGAGNDLLSGGAGGERDLYNCGEDIDEAIEGDAFDRISSDCETVEVSSP